MIVFQILLYISLLACNISCARPALQTIALMSDSYSNVVEEKNSEVISFRHPNLKITDYKSFLIEDVDIYSHQFAGRKDIHPDQKKILAKTFWAEAVDALRGYPITDTPGPAVLRINIRIRDVHPSHWETDESKFLVMKFDTQIEKAAMELTCSDSTTGERILEMVHSLSGPQYFEDQNEKRLGNIRDAFRVWAHALRKRMDDAKLEKTGN